MPLVNEPLPPGYLVGIRTKDISTKDVSSKEYMLGTKIEKRMGLCERYIKKNLIECELEDVEPAIIHIKDLMEVAGEYNEVAKIPINMEMHEKRFKGFFEKLCKIRGESDDDCYDFAYDLTPLLREMLKSPVLSQVVPDGLED